VLVLGEPDRLGLGAELLAEAQLRAPYSVSQKSSS
jgi:hypothetical protein